MPRPTTISAILLVLFAVQAPAQESKVGEVKRGAYFVKYGQAKTLAETLAKHFKGVAEILPGPPGTANCLLIQSSPATFDEILKLLDKMDRKPATVAVEVLLISFPTNRVDGVIKTLEEKDFVGTIDEVAKRLEERETKGEIANLKRIQMSALEGQSATFSMSAQVPYTNSIVRAARGGLSQMSVNRVMIGDNVRVIPNVNADKSISLDVRISYSDMQTSDKVPPTGYDENGKALPAVVFPTGSVEAKVLVPQGKWTLLKNSKISRDDKVGATQIAICAKTVEGDAK